MSEQFRRLFSPLKIGSMSVSNRIFFGPHASPLSPVTDVPNERLINYLVTRAKGGAALIFDSWHYVGPQTTEPNYYSASEDEKAIPGFEKLTRAIHEQGARIIAQLSHSGRRAGIRAFGGAQMAPSPIDRGGMLTGAFHVPHEMDIGQIKRVQESYGRAARVLKQAGYDGIELRCVISGFLASFLSPASNIRSDEYGGSTGNRMRIILEILDIIRAAVGSSFVVGIRFDGDEFMNGGLNLEETRVIAAKFDASKKLDFLEVGAGSRQFIHGPSMYFPLAPFIHLGAAIKEVVTLPVLQSGRINDPVLAEQVLENNQVDMVGMVRPLICDPELPNKAREGRLDEIRKCLACNEACMPKYFEVLPSSCTLNPAAGREKEYALVPAATRKRVMVIGGGAAGLETARIAASRGHHVSLYEKDNALGGQLNIAALAPGRADFGEATRYFAYQMKALGVEVHLNTMVTPELVKLNKPDAVVVATGSLPPTLTMAGPDRARPVPGGDMAHVVSDRDVLMDKVEVGKNVVVIAEDHHNHALSVADFLADRGKKVEVLTRALHAGAQLDESTLEAIYTRLMTKGVVITVLTGVREIRDHRIVTFNDLTGAEGAREGVDTVVVAGEGIADDAIYRSLTGQVNELYLIGQALAPRLTYDSVWDGYRVGRML